MFFMGEYASMLVVSGIATTLWLGGWQPLIPALGFIPSAVWFLAKLTLFILVYVWLRASLPRLRYDALMNLGWKRLLPASLILLFVVAAIDAFTTPVAAVEPGAEPRPSSRRSQRESEIQYRAPASATDNIYVEPPPPAPAGVMQLRSGAASTGAPQGQPTGPEGNR
jgi:NADH-quinone oxidoreductase subunit H